MDQLGEQQQQVAPSLLHNAMLPPARRVNMANEVTGSGTQNNGNIDDHSRTAIYISIENYLDIRELNGRSKEVLPQNLSRLLDGSRDPVADSTSADDAVDWAEADDTVSFESHYPKASVITKHLGQVEKHREGSHQILTTLKSLQYPRYRRLQNRQRRQRRPNHTYMQPLSKPVDQLLLLLKRLKDEEGYIRRLLRMPLNPSGGQDPAEALETLTGELLRAERAAEKMQTKAARMDEKRRRLQAAHLRAGNLKPDLVRCLEHAEEVTGALEQSIHLFQELLFSLQQQQANPQEVDDLRVLGLTRDASRALCEHLGDLCPHPHHETHQVYFSLDVKQQPMAKPDAVEFLLACQKTNNQKDGLVWMRVKSLISPPVMPNVPQATNEGLFAGHPPRPHHGTGRVPSGGGQFCPELSFPEFDFWVGQSHVSIDAQESGKGHPTLLSDWIKSFQAHHARIALARMIAEAVLKLSPILWRPTGLETTKIVIFSPRFGVVDSHINICLERPTAAPDDAAHRDAMGQSKRIVQSRQVLLELGLTLLEIAYRTKIPRPRPGDWISDPQGEEALAIRDKCFDEHLKKEMGSAYVDVIQFCLLTPHKEGEMYEMGIQRNFYRNVICALKREEESYDLSEMSINLGNRARRDGWTQTDGEFDAFASYSQGVTFKR